MQVATRGIAAVGQSTFLFGSRPISPRFRRVRRWSAGSRMARRAVREQLGRGADLINDLRGLARTDAHDRGDASRRGGGASAPSARSPPMRRRPWAIRNAVQAGVDSIEHGHRRRPGALELMEARGVYLVPTVSVVDASVTKAPSSGRRPRAELSWSRFVRQWRSPGSSALGYADGSDPAGRRSPWQERRRARSDDASRVDRAGGDPRSDDLCSRPDGVDR
jgi:hypothetical protein